MTNPLYRDQGAVGALLDEYEKALNELKALISTVTQDELMTVVDAQTEDESCRSIKTILDHVVGAGKHYVEAIRIKLGESLSFSERVSYSSISDLLLALDEMFEYNVQLFSDYPDTRIEAHGLEEKILTRWGQTYDIEQLMEHAIVHILRHRRQIERFLLKLRIDI